MNRTSRAGRQRGVPGLALALAIGLGAACDRTDHSAGETRERFARLLGIPAAPPAVAVTVHGARSADGLRVEELSWESLDGERVPAFLLRPETSSYPLPAVVCLHGSGGSRESMTAESFGPGPWLRPGDEREHLRMLGWARELARRGYVVLALTQRGLDARRPPINQQANVMLVEGRTAMGAVLHEIRQAVTHLADLPAVDPARIATAGMSFGGITSFYAWVVDDRITAAAPICGGVGSVEIFARLGRIGYHGTYWWIPDMLAHGDQAEFAKAMAPRPLMLWAPVDDVGMPKEGVDAFVEAVAPAYRGTGRPSAFVAHQPPGGHSFTLEAFEAMVEFFDTHLRPSSP
jgi:dienelactone hydrolase